MWMGAISEQRRRWIAGEHYAPEPWDLPEECDLPQAQVQSLRVERTGHTLGAHVELAGPTPLRLDLTDVRAAHFDTAGATGAAVSFTDGIEIRLGRNGFLRAAGSPAPSPPSPSPPSDPAALRPPPLEGPISTDAVLLLHNAMLKIRNVRYSKRVGQVPLTDLARLFANAGTRVLEANSRSLKALSAEWATASFKQSRPAATPDDHLTLATYRAADPREPVAYLNSAVPDTSGVWQLRSAEIPHPARFRLTADDGQIEVKI